MKPYFQLNNVSLLALLHQYPAQDQQTWTADHSFVHPSHSLDHCQARCTIYSHIVLSSHQLAHDEFQQVELLLPIKMNDRTHFFFCPLFQYGRHLETTAVSVHVA
jgi:hypothetical protein